MFKSCNLWDQWLKTAKRIHQFEVSLLHTRNYTLSKVSVFFSPLVSMNTCHYKNCLEFVSSDLWGFTFSKDVLMLHVFGINDFELSHYGIWELAHLHVAGLLALNGLLGQILREFLGELLLGNLVLDLSQGRWMSAISDNPLPLVAWNLCAPWPGNCLLLSPACSSPTIPWESNQMLSKWHI